MRHWAVTTWLAAVATVGVQFAALCSGVGGRGFIDFAVSEPLVFKTLVISYRTGVK